MSDIKISVIMPVYNVERYIERAILSIREQTFTDWELFLVDDGSPDDSGAICDRYAKDDERIRVIHQKNSGAPAARNAAIELAKGDFFYFMDSDDWCEADMLADLYELAMDYRADYVVAGYFIDTYYGEGAEDFMRLGLAPEREKLYASAAAFRADAHKYFDKNLLYTPWNKLYKAEIIRKYNIRFPDTQWDDFPFNLAFIEHVERVIVTPEKYYHFLRARSESESEKFIPGLYEKREEEHGWLLAMYRRWERTTNPGILKNEEVREFISRRYIERLIGCFENLTNPRAPEKSSAIIRQRMNRMLLNPRVRKTLKYARPRSFYMKLMLLPVRLRRSLPLYLEIKAISFVKTHNTRLFSFLKSRR